MAEDGKLLGLNFIKRLLRILPWAEQQMGEVSTPGRRPQILQSSPHLGKLGADLLYNDATGVTVTIWTGKPAVVTTRTIDNVVISELWMTSGQLDSGDFVKIERIDGLWFVTGAACA